MWTIILQPFCQESNDNEEYNRFKNVKSKSKRKKSNLISNKHGSYITSRVATQKSNCQIHRMKEVKVKDDGISHYKSKHIAVTVTPPEIEKNRHKNELKIKEGGISHYKSKDIIATVTPHEIEKLLDITPPHLTDDDSKPTWVSCPNPWGKVQHDDI